MRWLFADPNDAQEADFVRERIAAIDAWWQAFQSQADKIEAVSQGKSKWNLPKFMEETLQAVDPRLMWEFGPGMQESSSRLVITPESRRFLRPMVRTILERAPKLPGWEFYPYRLAEKPEQCLQLVKSRLGVKIDGTLIEASIAPGRKVDLNFSFPKKLKLDDETAMQAAFVATETLLGEQLLDTWIGTIGLCDGEDEPDNVLLPLDQAQATVAGLIRAILNQLPNVRTQDISVGDDWATVKLDPPEPADDYAGRDDLMLATTHNVEMFEAIHGGQPFTSTCHSKVGELFGYLKLDGEDISREEFVAFRSKFEDALNPALLAAGVGCTVGGGSGLRYAYIDLALTDLKHAVPIIRNVLAEHRAPLRSWLLFHDDDLGAEWIGIYRETTAPPAPAAE